MIKLHPTNQSYNPCFKPKGEFIATAMGAYWVGGVLFTIA